MSTNADAHDPDGAQDANHTADQTPRALDAVEIRDWNGGAFDPTQARIFSILPPVDADEGYCVRHDVEMQALDPVVHYRGGLYTTADGWHVYSCPYCRREIGYARAVQHYRQSLIFTFFAWDDPDTDGLDGAFQFLREGTAEDLPDDLATAATTGGEADA